MSRSTTKASSDKRSQARSRSQPAQAQAKALVAAPEPTEEPGAEPPAEPPAAVRWSPKGSANGARQAPAPAAPPTETDDLLGAQRLVLLTGIVLSAVVFWRGTIDTFHLSKATVAVSVALVLIACSAARVLATRRLSLPATPFVWLAAAFTAALLVSTLVAEPRSGALFGQYRRFGGLVPYLTAVVFSLFTLRLFALRSVVPLAKAILVGLGLVEVYGVIQVLGADPYRWNQFGITEIFSTFGNTNFFAGYVAITLPIAVWAVLARSLPLAWRVAGGVLTLVGAWLAAASNSFQGPAAAAPAVVVVLVAWALEHRGALGWHSSRTRLLAAGGAVTALTALAVVGPRVLSAVRGGFDNGLIERTSFYRAAWGMFVDHPIAGVGLDNYNNFYLRYRPDEHAALSPQGTTDGAHSVPLSMFANGGLLLGLTWVAVVAFVAWVLVRGLLRTRGDDRLLLGGLGGAWVGYQLQSAVSFDMPPLSLLHWVLAAAIVVAATRPELRSVALAPKAAPVGSGGREPAQADAPKGWHLALVGVLAVAGMWVASRPLRADAAAMTASQQRGGDALASMNEAVELAPWESSYALARVGTYGRLLGRERRATAGEARRETERAAELEPGNSVNAAASARLAAAAKDDVAAARWWTEAVRRDPKNTDQLVEASRFWARTERPDEAARLLDRAVEVDPEDAPLWLAVAKVRATIGDARGADDAYQRVRELNPRLAPAVKERPKGADRPDVRPLLAEARSLVQQGRPADARLRLDEAAAKDDENATTWLEVAKLRAATGDARGADAAYQRVRLLNPALAPAISARPLDVRSVLDEANSLTAAGQPAKAARLLERAAAVEAGSAPLWLNLGKARAAAGEPARAEIAYQQLRRVAPAYAPAVTARPMQVQVVLAEANTLLARNQPQEAARLLDEAVAVKADSAPLWYSLARARGASGDRKGADGAIGQARQIEAPATGRNSG